MLVPRALVAALVLVWPAGPALAQETPLLVVEDDVPSSDGHGSDGHASDGHASDEAGRTVRILDEGAGPALGLGAATRARTATAPLPSGCALMAFSDGLYEIRDGDGARLGYSGLVDLVSRFPLPRGEHALRRLVTSLAALNGGPLDDDAAALLIARR